MSEVSAEAYATLSGLFGGPKLTVAQSAVAMHECSRKAQAELSERLAAEQKAAAREMEAAECRQREDAMANAVNYVLAEQLQDEHTRTWPDEITLATYEAAAKRFAQWCKECGIGFLPAQGSAVAAYLLDIVEDSQFTMTVADARMSIKAIEFMHDIGQHYLNRQPIAAALEFIQLCYAQEKLNPTTKGNDNAD